MLHDVLYLAQQTINALQQGSIYALIALGYTMVYGVLTMINFAHGDLFMLGAFACMLLAGLLSPVLVGFPPVLAFIVILVLVMLIIGVLGASIERIAYRPLRNAPRVSAIITALGCGLLIESLTLVVFPYSKSMPTRFTNTTIELVRIANPADPDSPITLSVTVLQLLIICVAFILMVALDFLIRKTRYGMAMRAISFDSRTVPLMGIPVDRIISLTFLIGAGLGGAAGMLYGLAYPVIAPSMGILVGWKAFIAAVVGGIGNIRGAVLGGFILGAVEVVAVVVFDSSYRDLISYSLLLVILIFKPYGLLGQAPVQKV
ncbi:MAG TPA: branched-chain amino acid ABC transporter permease [Terrimicrobiaceae bacterium]|mgnify:CR=1 FL=1|nr:branched-chain amino acid ABC transporter permease [Terrimicrobiaceae bacterium]